MAENTYLLLNEEDIPVAHGQLENHRDSPQLRVRVLNGQIDEVAGLELVKLVGFSRDVRSILGTLVRRAGDVVILRQVDSGADIRETLRVEVRFETLIYPLNGIFQGRRKVEFINLSCGGIAFYYDEQLEVGDRFEVVIPVTPQPLVLRAQLLRTRSEGGRWFCAAKFVDMCYEEEKLVCEAVFGIQLRQHKKMKQYGQTKQ